MFLPKDLTNSRGRGDEPVPGPAGNRLDSTARAPDRTCQHGDLWAGRDLQAGSVSPIIFVGLCFLGGNRSRLSGHRDAAAPDGRRLGFCSPASARVCGCDTPADGRLVFAAAVWTPKSLFVGAA